MIVRSLRLFYQLGVYATSSTDIPALFRVTVLHWPALRIGEGSMLCIVWSSECRDGVWLQKNNAMTALVAGKHTRTSY